MKLPLRSSLVVLGSIATLGLGCAHSQARTTHEAPAPVAVAPPVAAPKATPTPEQDKEALLSQATLHFDFDADTLTPESQDRLDKIAQVLRTHAGLHAKVAGNCDDRGTTEYNLALGQRRAGVAKRYLVQLGIEPARVDTISYGEERPVNTAQSEAAWAQNRRDDIDVSGGAK